LIFDLSIWCNFAFSPTTFAKDGIDRINIWRGELLRASYPGRRPPRRVNSRSALQYPKDASQPSAFELIIRSAGRRRDRFLKRVAPGNNKRRMQRPRVRE